MRKEKFQKPEVRKVASIFTTTCMHGSFDESSDDAKKLRVKK